MIQFAQSQRHGNRAIEAEKSKIANLLIVPRNEIEAMRLSAALSSDLDK